MFRAPSKSSAVPVVVSASLAILLAVSSLGCQGNRKSAEPAPTAPISAAQLVELRSEFVESDPGAKVGLVGEVLPDGDYLRVSDVQAMDFPAGSSVLVIDANKDALAHGTVYATLEGYADVKFERVSGKRRPATGDAVVKFSSPATR